MPDTIIQFINTRLRRTIAAHRDVESTLLRFQPGHALNLAEDLALRFSADRDLLVIDGLPRNPYRFQLTVERLTPNNNQTFVMGHADVLDLPGRFALWPVALELDLNNDSLHSVICHAEGRAVALFNQYAGVAL